MLLLAAAALAASPCPADLEACLEGSDPLEVRRAALAAADLRDDSVRSSLLRVLVDDPLHADVVRALVEAGLIPARLSGQVPTRSRVARAIGRSPDGCALQVGAGGVAVQCRERIGCAGSCSARYRVARLGPDGSVERGELQFDDGSCGCCQFAE